jgi:hypothetical protein
MGYAVKIICFLLMLLRQKKKNQIMFYITLVVSIFYTVLKQLCCVISSLCYKVNKLVQNLALQNDHLNSSPTASSEP